MAIVCIADVLIEYTGFLPTDLKLEKFIVPGEAESEFRFIYENASSPGFSVFYGIGHFCDNRHFYLSQKNGTYALLNSERTIIKICTPYMRHESVSEITAAMSSLCLLKFNVLLVHASLVDMEGEGILFIGKSGIGKTTQAEQWHKHRGALIINGDLAFIRRCEDGFWGYGSPWHGSSPYCENRKTKLRAIVALKQSPNNRISRLKEAEAILEAEKSVYLHKWRKDDLETALAVFDDLMGQVPVYLLECRVEKEAVDITYEAVFGSRLDTFSL